MGYYSVYPKRISKSSHRNCSIKKLYLMFNITALSCLTAGVELYVGAEVFPQIFKMKRSKQNEIMELGNFSLRMGVANYMGDGVVGSGQPFLGG